MNLRILSIKNLSKSLLQLLRRLNRGTVKILALLIDTYRLIFSGLLGGRCRFYPSCSIYSKQAFQLHGLRGGVILSVNRLSKCHPLGKSGFDPVPHSHPGDLC